jgi:hypothetical protein
MEMKNRIVHCDQRMTLKSAISNPGLPSIGEAFNLNHQRIPEILEFLFC